MTNRYDIGGEQGMFEPGSQDQVLRNKLGVNTPAEIAEIELLLLEKIYQSVLVDGLPEQAISVKEIKTWHRRWLGNVYTWAGEERSVNMAKGDFQFAAAAQIPRLMKNLERDCLARFTPCHGFEGADLADAIAITHVEFILIHPFREGNGRLSRLLADVMAVQAGQNPLDYSAWDKNKEAYFGAIQTGLAGNYTPMKLLVEKAFTHEGP